MLLTPQIMTHSPSPPSSSAHPRLPRALARAPGAAAAPLALLEHAREVGASARPAPAAVVAEAEPPERVGV
ncbi:unnamed protein product [Closterium sp. NIES-64]|nr:unnamed protein product [Closterium sp. NIES-64]